MWGNFASRVRQDVKKMSEIPVMNQALHSYTGAGQPGQKGSALSMPVHVQLCEASSPPRSIWPILAVRIRLAITSVSTPVEIQARVELLESWIGTDHGAFAPTLIRICIATRYPLCEPPIEHSTTEPIGGDQIHCIGLPCALDEI